MKSARTPGPAGPTAWPAPAWLFVDAIPHFGGHEVMLLRWLEELQRHPGPRPRLLARQGGRLFELAPAQTRCPPFARAAADARPGLWQRLQNLRRELRTLDRALRHERPEVVIVASGALGYQIPLVLLARWRGAPVLVYVPMLGSFTSMGYRLGWAKDAFVRWLYGRVPRGWVAITAEQAEDFKRWARPSGPVFVLPNTVARSIEDAPRLVPRALAAEQPLQVLLLGRLDAPQKGLDLLLAHLEHAAPGLLGKLSFCLAGDGPYAAVLQARLAANPALRGCLRMQAWQPTLPALAAHDVLLLTSRFEGVPLVMLEALALGLPVVASNLPGTRAYLPAECLFEVGDLAQATRILQRLHDVVIRQTLAQQGRHRYEAGASALGFSQAVQALSVQVREELLKHPPCDTPLGPQPEVNRTA